MRSNEIFSRMTPEAALAFLNEVHETAPAVEEIALSAAAGAFRLRPVFLRRQPRKRQAEWMRQALARTAMAAVAEEVLAEYFLEYHPDLLAELLDALGLEHEKGVLKSNAPECPKPAELAKLVAAFRTGKDPERRELLMRAFAAQSSIDWPDLEALLSS
ncbi:MAG: hypothetical protein WEF50_21170 [Myxococcota bacterium]